MWVHYFSLFILPIISPANVSLREVETKVDANAWKEHLNQSNNLGENNWIEFKRPQNRIEKALDKTSITVCIGISTAPAPHLRWLLLCF